MALFGKKKPIFVLKEFRQFFITLLPVVVLKSLFSQHKSDYGSLHPRTSIRVQFIDLSFFGVHFEAQLTNFRGFSFNKLVPFVVFLPVMIQF